MLFYRSDLKGKQTFAGFVSNHRFLLSIRTNQLLISIFSSFPKIYWKLTSSIWQKLIVPFEMRGYQGVYNLERKVHEELTNEGIHLILLFFTTSLIYEISSLATFALFCYFCTVVDI